MYDLESIQRNRKDIEEALDWDRAVGYYMSKTNVFNYILISRGLKSDSKLPLV